MYTPIQELSETNSSMDDTCSRTSSQQVWTHYFYKKDLKARSISVSEENNVECLTVELPEVVIQSVYKPPDEPFVLPPLCHRNQPHIIIGYFQQSL